MKKKKIRTKTPSLTIMMHGVEDKGSEYFWQFSDAQLEKIDRMLTEEYDSRMDEHGYIHKWWRNDSTAKKRYRMIKESFDIHSMQRIFMNENYVEKWEKEPGPKGKFEWQKQSTDSGT